MARKWLVTRTPKTWAGTIAEAAFGTAGRSIIVGREWFRFKKGRGLVNSDAAVAEARDDFCIIRAGEVSNEQIEALRRMTGRRWSPLFNCLTAFAPFWEGRMSRISPDDRQSIARYVTLTVFLTAAITISGGYLLDRYITGLLDERHHSLTVHLGQIKAMIRDLEGRE